ncbi:hypothetical protein AgCh_029042 [Apium graveolens]
MPRRSFCYRKGQIPVPPVLSSSEFVVSDQDKFKKYWADFNTILAIASILDPRYKLSSVDFFYKIFYCANSFQFDNLKEKLFSLFNEYASTTTTGEQSPLSQKQSRADVLYANEGQDVFQKGNQFRYPELEAMAHDILSIPISTVSSEATFSAGGRILDEYQSSLLPENAEAIICSRDWLNGERGKLTIAHKFLLESDLSVAFVDAAVPCAGAMGGGHGYIWMEPALELDKEGGVAFLQDDYQFDARQTVAYIDKVNMKYETAGRYKEYYHEPVEGLLR